MSLLPRRWEAAKAVRFERELSNRKFFGAPVVRGGQAVRSWRLRRSGAGPRKHCERKGQEVRGNFIENWRQREPRSPAEDARAINPGSGAAMMPLSWRRGRGSSMGRQTTRVF